jgi:hypothetical protein
VQRSSNTVQWPRTNILRNASRKKQNVLIRKLYSERNTVQSTRQLLKTRERSAQNGDTKLSNSRMETYSRNAFVKRLTGQKERRLWFAANGLENNTLSVLERNPFVLNTRDGQQKDAKNMLMYAQDMDTRAKRLV